ncbi:MAG: alpha-mannosidase [Clostridia bacterium]|jgi:alpha-mannosidase
MSTLDVRLMEMKKKTKGYWAERILAQVEYLARISKIKNAAYDHLVEASLDFLANKFSEDTVITKAAALEAERILLPAAEVAKSYHILCAAHAHIDMNWMWAFDETVAITLDTFRTMLDLMEEYPDFTFSQSQASVYRIVEEFAPEMLEEIKARVKERRWEVTASTWVEADKNMPNGESMSRHILYTRNYLSKLLDICPDSLSLDFEPDTFGHSQNVPEILNKGGIKYYYHCRGYEGHNLYRWESPSGKAITVYRDPFWYNGEISPEMAFYAPEFCSKYHMDTMLKVYGVGDHGGGPTRRDIERALAMNTWPVFPSIRFGTFKEFFGLTDKVMDRLPVVKGELNFIFTGCYTSQSRIKLANRMGEATLNEAEAFDAVSALCTGSRYSPEIFAKAWENVLFNQFHDIIPGSGIIDTREYAMGLFQRTMAIANTRRKLAMRNIAARIDTSDLIPADEDIRETRSEGAGVGFGIQDFKIAQAERGRGITRIFHIFNPAPVDREETAELVVWDWQGDPERILFKDDRGNPVTHQLIDQGMNHYWGHSYMRILLKANVRAYGYRTYTMTEDRNSTFTDAFPQDARTEKIDEFILENKLLKVTFDTRNAAIVSMIDKTNGEEFVAKNRPAGIFRLIQEDDYKGMTAWIVGRYMDIKDLTEGVRVKKVHYRTSPIRQSITYEMAFSNSTLKVVVSLDHDSPRLKFEVECDWHEIGRKGEGIPQLNFYVPVAYPCSSFKYDVPFGAIDREPMDRDVPGNSFILANRQDLNGKTLMLVTDSKYGFRGYDNAMAVTLIRSSFDPDPYPEQGIHRFKLTLCLVESRANKDILQEAYNCCHPFSVLSDTAHAGSFPLSQSFFCLEEGSVALSALKMPEVQEGDSEWVLRVYETEGSKTKAVFRLPQTPTDASYVDINERPVDNDLQISTGENQISFEVPAYSVATVRIKF